jgi:hypothetical protein
VLFTAEHWNHETTLNVRNVRLLDCADWRKTLNCLVEGQVFEHAPIAASLGGSDNCDGLCEVTVAGGRGC